MPRLVLISYVALLIVHFQVLMGQTVPFRLEEAIDDADVVLVGRVSKSDFLTHFPSPNSFEIINDAQWFVIRVDRVLKGQLEDITVVQIINPVASGGAIFPLHLLENKKYLLYLNTASVDSSLAERHHLEGAFFFPLDGNYGISDLDKEGRRELKETERYFSILPPLPPAGVLVSALLDTLVAKKHKALSDGLLGDHRFADELDDHLERAISHLERSDSLKCRRDLEAFRIQIKLVHRRTKSAHATQKGRQFINDGVFRNLYYYAQYIIDRLSKRSRNDRNGRNPR